MKAIVCVKQVPDTQGKVAVKADGTMDRSAMATITNPDDLNAVEAALSLKDELGCKVVGVDDGLHRGTIQGAVGVHCHLTGGIGNLLHSNKNFHFTFYLLNYLTPRWLEMTMRWTSEVPS